MGELVKGKIVGGCCGGEGPRWGVGGTRGQSAAVRVTPSPARCWEQATQPNAARDCSWGRKRMSCCGGCWLLSWRREEKPVLLWGRAAGWPVAGGGTAAHWRCKGKREKEGGKGVTASLSNKGFMPFYHGYYYIMFIYLFI